RVLVDGKVMSMDEANSIVKRSEVRSVAASAKAYAKKYLNLDYNILTLSIHKNIDFGRQGDSKPNNSTEIDTVPSSSNKNYIN
ncbi:MAG: hypothetical protein ABUT20_63360, partial [Bacteroidota bacterium]